MTTKEFTIEIKAPSKKVWFALWDEYQYSQWTRAFCEDAYILTDWVEGNRVHFLTPGGDGMYSTLTESKEFEKMYFTHIGDVKNFEEQPLDEKSTEWTGARENYTLTETNGITRLDVVMDLSEEHVEYFQQAFTKGLQSIKEAAENLYIIVETEVKSTIDKVWASWTEPAHIVHWNHASDDWHTTKAENDLSKGGKFLYRMEAKDGSFGFDFWGLYETIEKNKMLSYQMGDGRNAIIRFTNTDSGVKITESFEPESTPSFSQQKIGWQAILANFKQYVEKI